MNNYIDQHSISKVALDKLIKSFSEKGVNLGEVL